MVLSIAIHGVFLATAGAKFNRVPISHPAIYGMGNGPSVVSFLSGTFDVPAEADGALGGNPRAPGEESPKTHPELIEVPESSPLTGAQPLELRTAQTSAPEDAQPAEDVTTVALQKESIAVVATVNEHSPVASAADGNVAGSMGGQGNGGPHGEIGPGRPGSAGGGGFGKPAYLRNPLPPYPRVAREHGWEGTTLLRVEVLDDGSGGTVEILKSSGYQVLDEASLETVRHWRFLPARSGDIPIRSLVEIPIRFHMTGD